MSDPAGLVDSLLDDLPSALVSILTVVSAVIASRAWIQAAGRSGRALANKAIDNRELDFATRTLREEFLASTSGAGTAGGATAEPPTAAELEVMAIMKVYGKDLFAEANRIARRANADAPSKKHVRQAADRIGVLRERSGVASDLFLAVGSILVGAAVSYQINLWTGGTASSGVALAMIVCFAIGVGFVVGAGTVKWRRS